MKQKMNILLVSYGNYEYNGRLRELVRVFEKIGSLYTFIRGVNENTDNSFYYHGDNYLDFIIKAIKYAKSIEPFDILVIDDRRAIIPGLIIKNRCKPKLVIQDCRELYLIKDVKHLVGKIGCIIENPSIKKADIVICANYERADYMKQIYKLEEKPISYENIRQLEYSDKLDFKKFEEKFSSIIRKDEIRIISTAGCRVERTNDVLVRNMKFLPASVRLIIVGEDSASDRDIIRKIIKENGIQNVIILGRLKQDELKYLIDNSHIGIVNYNQLDLNNKFCASGKLYEFIFEGIPVVTTTNPPLKRICEENEIGIADNDYYHGIERIIKNYAFYKSNVARINNIWSVERNNQELFVEMTKRINRKLNPEVIVDNEHKNTFIH